MLERLFGRAGRRERREPVLLDLAADPDPPRNRLGPGTEPTPAAPSARPSGAKAASGQRPSVRTPAVTRTAPVILEDHTYAEHAQALLDWLREPGSRGRSGEILAPEMIEIYTEMCAELGWREHCWNPVAHAFTALTTGQKRYAWVLDNGRRRRLRVYPVAGVTELGKVLDLSVLRGPAATASPLPAGSPKACRQGQSKRAAA